MNYFAYAANLNREQMLERCPDSKPMLVAALHDYVMIFVGKSKKWRGGAATIKPLRGGMVLGAVYDASERDLKQLDEYESEVGRYKRLNVTVFRKDGRPVEAITYIKSARLKEAQPSKEYSA